MKTKRFFAAILSLTTVFSLASCRQDNTPDTVGSTAQDSAFEAADITFADEMQTAEIPSSSVSDITVTQVTEEGISSEETSSGNPDDPAVMTVEEIVAEYKKAAKKSGTAVESEQIITLKSISVNNGEHEGLFEFITPIMSKLLANNSKKMQGITGGYDNLSAADIAHAKAYKSGDNTAVELVMKEQTAGACDDALSGSVGHAITAVGDISVVTKQLKDLGIPLDISEENTTIYYTDPTVKVLINSNGEIISGTWQYTVEISLKNYKAFGKDVNTTSVIMENTITVGDGFTK